MSRALLFTFSSQKNLLGEFVNSISRNDHKYATVYSKVVFSLPPFANAVRDKLLRLWNDYWAKSEEILSYLQAKSQNDIRDIVKVKGWCNKQYYLVIHYHSVQSSNLDVLSQRKWSWRTRLLFSERHTCAESAVNVKNDPQWRLQETTRAGYSRWNTNGCHHGLRINTAVRIQSHSDLGPCCIQSRVVSEHLTHDEYS